MSTPPDALSRLLSTMQALKQREQVDLEMDQKKDRHPAELARALADAKRAQAEAGGAELELENVPEALRIKRNLSEAQIKEVMGRIASGVAAQRLHGLEADYMPEKQAREERELSSRERMNTALGHYYGSMGENQMAHAKQRVQQATEPSVHSGQSILQEMADLISDAGASEVQKGHELLRMAMEAERLTTGAGGGANAAVHRQVRSLLGVFADSAESPGIKKQIDAYLQPHKTGDPLAGAMDKYFGKSK